MKVARKVGQTTSPTEVEDIELELLLDAIYRRYGVDFRGYLRSSLRRRILLQVDQRQLNDISELTAHLLRDETVFLDFLSKVYVSVTEFFRDPGFFAALRKKVFPCLETFPSIKIWHAGCATGEEVYSLAILLDEAGLLARCQIYATDANTESLQKAKLGQYSNAKVREAGSAYRDSGGNYDLQSFFVDASSSCDNDSKSVVIERIRRRITWAHHDLSTESMYNEVHLVLCRNTLMYFGADMRELALSRLRRSLGPNGFIGLGSGETIELSSKSRHFGCVDSERRIYRRNALPHLGRIQ